VGTGSSPVRIGLRDTNATEEPPTDNMMDLRTLVEKTPAALLPICCARWSALPPNGWWRWKSRARPGPARKKEPRQRDGTPCTL